MPVNGQHSPLWLSFTYTEAVKKSMGGLLCVAMKYRTIKICTWQTCYPYKVLHIHACPKIKCNKMWLVARTNTHRCDDYITNIKKQNNLIKSKVIKIFQKLFQFMKQKKKCLNNVGLTVLLVWRVTYVNLLIVITGNIKSTTLYRPIQYKIIRANCVWTHKMCNGIMEKVTHFPKPIYLSICQADCLLFL